MANEQSENASEGGVRIPNDDVADWMAANDPEITWASVAGFHFNKESIDLIESVWVRQNASRWICLDVSDWPTRFLGNRFVWSELCDAGEWYFYDLQGTLYWARLKSTRQILEHVLSIYESR